MASAAAAALMKEALACEQRKDLHEAVAKLEQAKATLLEDETAAASAHSATITRINNKTVQIFELFRKNYYVVLGVANGADDADIKKSYRKLALKYHPDKNRYTSAVFQAIQSAYETLSDDKLRRDYDRKLGAQPRPPQQQRPSTSGGVPSTQTPPVYGWRASSDSRSSKPPPPAAASSSSAKPPPFAAPRPSSTEGTFPSSYVPPQSARRPSTTSSFDPSAGTSSEFTALFDVMIRQWAGLRRAGTTQVNIEAFAFAFARTNVAGGLESQRAFLAYVGQRCHFSTNTFNAEAAAKASASDPPPPSSRRPSTASSTRPKPAGPASTTSATPRSHDSPYESYDSYSGAGFKFRGDADPDVFGRSSAGQPPGRPGAPRLKEATDTTIMFEWNVAPETNRMGASTGFQLQWRKVAQPQQDWVPVDKLLSGTQCLKKNLDASSSYEFRVRASNAFGSSGWSRGTVMSTSAVPAHEHAPTSASTSASTVGSSKPSVRPRPAPKPSPPSHEVSSDTTSSSEDEHDGQWMKQRPRTHVRPQSARPSRPSTASSTTAAPEDDPTHTAPSSCYYEYTDPVSGVPYYIFSETGESSWEQPKWRDEYDESSGYTYFINTKTGASQWEMPFDFVPIIRSVEPNSGASSRASTRQGDPAFSQQPPMPAGSEPVPSRPVPTSPVDKPIPQPFFMTPPPPINFKSSAPAPAQAEDPTPVVVDKFMAGMFASAGDDDLRPTSPDYSSVPVPSPIVSSENQRPDAPRDTSGSPNVPEIHSAAANRYRVRTPSVDQDDLRPHSHRSSSKSPVFFTFTGADQTPVEKMFTAAQHGDEVIDLNVTLSGTPKQSVNAVIVEELKTPYPESAPVTAFPPVSHAHVASPPAMKIRTDDPRDGVPPPPVSAPFASPLKADCADEVSAAEMATPSPAAPGAFHDRRWPERGPGRGAKARALRRSTLLRAVQQGGGEGDSNTSFVVPPAVSKSLNHPSAVNQTPLPSTAPREVTEHNLNLTADDPVVMGEFEVVNIDEEATASHKPKQNEAARKQCCAIL